MPRRITISEDELRQMLGLCPGGDIILVTGGALCTSGSVGKYQVSRWKNGDRRDRAIPALVDSLAPKHRLEGLLSVDSPSNALQHLNSRLHDCSLITELQRFDKISSQ